MGIWVLVLLLKTYFQTNMFGISTWNTVLAVLTKQSLLFDKRELWRQPELAFVNGGKAQAIHSTSHYHHSPGPTNMNIHQAGSSMNHQPWLQFSPQPNLIMQLLSQICTFSRNIGCQRFEFVRCSPYMHIAIYASQHMWYIWTMFSGM